VAAVVLLAGGLVAPWATGGLVRPGMTRDAVEVILGDPTGVDMSWTTLMSFDPNPLATPEEWARFREYQRDYTRKHWRGAFTYDYAGREVTVVYHAPDDESRVLAVEQRGGPEFTRGQARYLVPWAVLGAVLGIGMAELMRRRRPAPLPVPTA
jgi:hypothetical protein